MRTVRGVSWIVREGNWRASIKIKDKSIQIGSFKTFEEAAEARRLAELKYWGFEWRPPCL